jgi:hypothetical protein
MFRRLPFYFLASFALILSVHSILEPASQIRVYAEGVDVSGQIVKVPPLSLQVLGGSSTPFLYDDRGGNVPWAGEPVRKSNRWFLTPQILESGTYRIVSGKSSSLFSVRAASATPPTTINLFTFLPIAIFAILFFFIILIFRARRGRSALALILAVATIFPLLSISTTPALASEPTSLSIDGDVYNDVAPPLNQDNRRLPSLVNDGTLLYGKIGPILTPNDCLSVNDNTLDLTYLAAGCLAVSFRQAGENNDLATIVEFWNNPPPTFVNLSLACTMATLEMAADLSRRLSQEKLLIGELNKCDYSYLTGIGAGQARAAATVQKGLISSLKYCDSFLRGIDQRFTLEIVIDKCHRGVGQSIATRSGGDANLIIDSCSIISDETLEYACVDGGFSYLVNLDIERDSHRLENYWLDPNTACISKNINGSKACARFAVNEFYRRGVDLSSGDLSDFCKSWGKELIDSCAIGLGEVQAVYRDITGTNLKSAFDLCSISGNAEDCISRWMTTLLVRQSTEFVINLCKTLPLRYQSAGEIPCSNITSTIKRLSSKSKYEPPTSLPPSSKFVPIPDSSIVGSD